MRNININIYELGLKPVTLGYVGENEHTQIIFNCSSVFSQYPNAVPAITVQPPVGDAYPAVMSREEDNVIWNVANSDLVNEGNGEIQITFTENNIVVKSCIGKVKISKSIQPTGEAPEPIENWLVEANTALNAIPQTIDDALTEAKESGEFDGFSPVITSTEIQDGHRLTITDAEGEKTVDVLNGINGQDGYTPIKGVDYFDGEKGEQGERGPEGQAGYTPIKGVDYFDGALGEKGDKGDPGERGPSGQDGYTPVKNVDYFDGFSPEVSVASITGGHRVSVVDSEGTNTFDVMDGTPGAQGETGPSGPGVPTGGQTGQVLKKRSNTDFDTVWSADSEGVQIDDTAGAGDTNVTWSANKSTTALESKADKTDTVLNTTLSRGRLDGSTVGEASFAFGKDVTASGNTSHAEGYETIASGDYGSHAEGYYSEALGGYGSHAEGDSTRALYYASHSEGVHTEAESEAAHAEGSYTKASNYAAHAEGYCTLANGTYSHVSGIYNVGDSYNSWPEWTANTQYNVGDKVKRTAANNTVSGYICRVANSDATFNQLHWFVQSGRMNYAEIIGNGTDDNTRSNARVLDWDGNERIKGDLYVGCNSDSTGGTKVAKTSEVLAVDNQVVISSSQPQASSNKLWVDSTGGSEVSVPTYNEFTSLANSVVTDVQTNGTSIVSDGVANIPVADVDTLGTVKVRKENGYYGIGMTGSNTLTTFPANDNQIKNGTEAWKPINPMRQHRAAFYGLAKAAGVDMSSSSNEVGVYTNEAKVAIQKMLGIYEAPWELIIENTVTNNSEANIDVTVDGNGQALELTDIFVIFKLEAFENATASYGDYGRVRYYYGENNYIDTLSASSQTFTVNAGGTPKLFSSHIEQQNGAIRKWSTSHITQNSIQSMMEFLPTSSSSTIAPITIVEAKVAFNKIQFRSVFGKATYRIFGKRKWT